MSLLIGRMTGWLRIWIPVTRWVVNSLMASDYSPLLYDEVHERARWSYLACLGLPVISCNKIFSKSHIINPLLFSQGGWTLALFFFCEFMDLNFISVHTCKHTQKKNLANIQPCWPHTCSITHMSFPLKFISSDYLMLSHLIFIILFKQG